MAFPTPDTATKLIVVEMMLVAFEQQHGKVEIRDSTRSVVEVVDRVVKCVVFLGTETVDTADAGG